MVGQQEKTGHSQASADFVLFVKSGCLFHRMASYTFRARLPLNKPSLGIHLQIQPQYLIGDSSRIYTTVFPGSLYCRWLFRRLLVSNNSCMSTCQSICLSICLSFSLHNLSLSVCLSIYLSFLLSIMLYQFSFSGELLINSFNQTVLHGTYQPLTETVLILRGGAKWLCPQGPSFIYPYLQSASSYPNLFKNCFIFMYLFYVCQIQILIYSCSLV